MTSQEIEDKYKNHDPYPVPPRRPHLGMNEQSDVEKVKKYAAELEQYNKDVIPFEEALREWRRKEADLVEKFRKDALIRLGLSAHPKASLLYKKAWDHGHANGLSEVYWWLKDLAELLQ